MKLSEKYLRAHTDDYANFSYPSTVGTYSSAGIEIEKAEIYGEICRLESEIEMLEQFYNIRSSKGIKTTVYEKNARLQEIEKTLENKD